jgi:hypothetical protein
MTTRRAFLASLGLAPLVARSYFDMGAAWQRHASGLVVPSAYGESGIVVRQSIDLSQFVTSIVLRCDDGREIQFAGQGPALSEDLVGQRLRIQHHSFIKNYYN